MLISCKNDQCIKTIIFANLTTFDRCSELKTFFFLNITILKMGWLSKFQSRRSWGDAYISLGVALKLKSPNFQNWAGKNFLVQSAAQKWSSLQKWSSRCADHSGKRWAISIFHWKLSKGGTIGWFFPHFFIAQNHVFCLWINHVLWKFEIMSVTHISHLCFVN